MTPHNRFNVLTALAACLSLAALAVPASGALFINEIMSSNNSTISDATGDYADWIEIYNSGPDTVDLQGYGLSDNSNKPFKWQFPAFSLAPHAFLLVWASEKDTVDSQGAFHTNFKVSTEGEEILLTHPDSLRLQEVPPIPIATDASYGRHPDGGGDWFFFQSPTPGASNAAMPHVIDLVPLQFSHSAGYYAAPFDLTITTPDIGVAIHYTLDGSTPTASSPVYAGPINVRSRTGEPNSLSMIPTNYHWTLTTWIDWMPPKGEVFKATCLRAKAIRDGIHESPEVTRTFFVDPDMPNRYTLPVVSIVTDSVNFFSEETGIYVPGDGWTNYVPGTFSGKRFYAANFWQDGSEWERPVHMELFERDGTLGLSCDAGVRIHGKFSSTMPEKPLRFYQRSQANGFDYPFFGEQNGRHFERILLRNGGNDFVRTMFRDGMIQSLLETTTLDRQRYSPAIMFLNGEYWGIHNYRDRLDENHLAIKYGVDEAELDLLERRFENSVIVAGDATHYNAMMSYVATHPMTVTANYDYIKTQIDIDNFIDYFAFNIYIGNTDWPWNNIKYWRVRTDSYEPDAPYGQDGRWRWLMFDADYGFGGDPNLGTLPGYEHATLGIVMNPSHVQAWSTVLFRALIKNPQFKAAFLARFADLMNTVFQPDWVVSRIDEMAATIAPEMEEHISRWGYPWAVSAWESEVAIMRRFARYRPARQWSHLSTTFSTSALPVTIDVLPSQHGRVQVNSVLVDASTPGIIPDTTGGGYLWMGSYARGYPVTLVAKAKPGSHFIQWLGLEGTSAAARATEDSITVTLTSALTVTAVFSHPVAVEQAIHPPSFSLFQNAPNPFNPSTTLRFGVPEEGKVRLAVFDMTGALVRTLVDEHVEAGMREVVWDGRDTNGREAASGTYVYRLKSRHGTLVRRMTLLR